MLFGRLWNRALWLTVLFVALGVTTPPGAVRAVAVETARSTDGLVATGIFPNLKFPDGSERYLSIVLVIPKGETTSTDGLPGIDLARPWVAITETVMSGAATGTHCAGIRNPTNVSSGFLDARRPAWRGTAVEFPCNDGSGDIYRVSWEPGPADWMWSDVLGTTWTGGQIAKWSHETMSGQSEVVPSANQYAELTLCRLRGNSPHGTCHRSDHSGLVIPTAKAVFSHAQQ